MVHRVSCLIFEGFQILDAAGPLSALESANRDHVRYRVQVVAANSGPIQSSLGVSWNARALPPTSQVDTLLVAGGNGTREALACPRTRSFIRRVNERGARIASICTGAFLLAEAGLLDGLEVTTHWSRAQALGQRYPRLTVQSDRIYTQNGRIWTSAGISAGIDLTLALIAEDHGRALAQECARQLVVYLRRPGGQSQFSPLLSGMTERGPFDRLLVELRERIDEPWPLLRMAQEARMSERTFIRQFEREMGCSPARWLERLRVETARAHLEGKFDSVAEIAEAVGFGNAERMRKSFLRCTGVPPSAYRRRP